MYVCFCFMRAKVATITDLLEPKPAKAEDPAPRLRRQSFLCGST